MVEYRLQTESLIKREIGVDMPTDWGHFDLIAFRQKDTGDTHLALVKGTWEKNEPVLVRVHKSNVVGDIFGSTLCDSGQQLKNAMQSVENEGKGVILYMFQDGKSANLMSDLKKYKLQEMGVNQSAEITPNDERDYGIGAQILRDLGISKIKTCVGGSLGGQQAVEWAISQPELIENLILIATNAQHSPWGIAFNESQRMSIEVDPTWTESHPLAGINGMKAARATALISYRNYETYGVTQARREEGLDKTYRAVTYQRYQGEKLAQRFNAFSYYVLSQVMDSQDVGRGRGGVINALGQIKAKTLVMGIKSDALFPINEQEFLAKHIPDATFQALDSLYGHDGFLIENELITKAIKIWQKFIKLDVNPMYSFFKALEDRPRTLVAHD